MSKWKKRFLEDGVEGLKDKPNIGRFPAFDADRERSLLAKLLEPPPDGRRRWTLKLLGREFGVSGLTVQKALRNQKIRLVNGFWRGDAESGTAIGTLGPERIGEKSRKELEDLARDEASPAKLAKRAGMVLAWLDDEPLRLIAERFDKSPRTVLKWTRLFMEDGVEGLKDKPREYKPR